MIIKSKKLHNSRIIKSIVDGEVKECLPKRDLSNPRTEIVQICFRGNSSSGIVEMSHDEIKKVYKSIQKPSSKTTTKKKSKQTKSQK